MLSPRRFLYLSFLGALTVSTGALFYHNTALRTESGQLKASLQKLEQDNRKFSQEMARAVKENAELRGALESVQKEAAVMKAEIRRIRENLASVQEEKTYLEEILINKNKEIASIQGPPADASAPVPADAAVALRQKDEELTRLAEQNRILTGKLERLYKTAEEKIATINVAKIALEDTIRQARQRLEEEWSTVDLGSITAETKVTAPAPPVNAVPPRPAPAAQAGAPKTHGRILAVNDDHGFVVIDMGKVDGVRNDATFIVRRNDQRIAILSVIETRDVMSACNIRDLKQGQKLQVNDAVAWK